MQNKSFSPLVRQRKEQHKKDVSLGFVCLCMFVCVCGCTRSLSLGSFFRCIVSVLQQKVPLKLKRPVTEYHHNLQEFVAEFVREGAYFALPFLSRRRHLHLHMFGGRPGLNRGIGWKSRQSM